MLRRKIIVVILILLVACSISGCKITNIHETIQETIQETSRPKEEVSYQPQQTSEGNMEQEVMEEERKIDYVEDEIYVIPRPISTEVPKEESAEEAIVYDTNHDSINETVSGWYYDQLTINQKVIYVAILDNIDTIQKEYVKFIGANSDDISRVCDALIVSDMYITGVQYTWYTEEQSISIKMNFDSDVTKEEINRTEKEANKIIDELDGSEEEMIWQIYEYLTENVEYDDSTSKKHTRDLYGALIEKECVCMGYARAFTYLCDKIGIKAMTVFGEEHAWNYVQLSNQKWYAVDATWGKANQNQYFMCGTEFLNNHIPECDFEIPTLNSEALFPSQEQVKKITEHLERTISTCDSIIENFNNYEEYDETLYELYVEVELLASEILDKINESLCNSYINTEEFSAEYQELNSKIELANEY